jgi:methylated-DNA-[protein]-cysteine S-methyltransferase
MNSEFVSYYKSPIGLIEIVGTTTAVTELNFVDEQRHGSASHPTVRHAEQQVAEYFEGSRREFNLRLDMNGTEFQKLVWQRLQTVPYGRTASYQDIAKGIGRPAAVRAVGAANGRNPVAIIVPCHRIIGKNGHLVGYGSGIWRKEWLLKHEGYLLI